MVGTDLIMRLDQIQLISLFRAFDKMKRCDVCAQQFPHKRHQRKDAAYLVCQYCYDWSVGSRLKRYCRVIQEPLVTGALTGEAFSLKWRGKFSPAIKATIQPHSHQQR